MAKVLKIRRRQEEQDEEEAAPVRRKRVRDEEEEEEDERPVKKTKGDKPKAKKKASSPAGWTVGVTSGLGIAKYQNLTLENNRKAKRTDSQLAAMWRKEFPDAKAQYDEGTVRGVRSAYNRGKHGNEAPAKPVPEYDEEGNAMPLRGEKTAAKRAAREEREEEAPRRPVKKVKKAAR